MVRTHEGSPAETFLTMHRWFIWHLLVIYVISILIRAVIKPPTAFGPRHQIVAFVLSEPRLPGMGARLFWTESQ